MDRVEENFKRIVKAINDEKKKEEPDGVKILRLIRELYFAFGEERQLNRLDLSAIDTQCVAVYPWIMKKGLELDLSRCWDSYNHLHVVRGKIEGEDSKHSITIGNITDLDRGWYTLQTEYETIKKDAKWSGNWTFESIRGNYQDSIITGTEQIECPYSNNDKLKAIENYDFRLDFRLDGIRKNRFNHTIETIMPDGSKAKETEEVKKIGYDEPFNISAGAGFLDRMIARIPLLTVKPGNSEDSPYYMDSSLIMGAFYSDNFVKHYPNDGIREPDIDKVIDNIMQKGQGETAKDNQKWAIIIRGLTDYDEKGSKTAISIKIICDEESFKEEGLPLALIISYLAERKISDIKCINDIFGNKDNYIPAGIDTFSNNNVIITKGKNKLNHRLISDYDARNIIASYFAKRGFDSEKITELLKEIFDRPKNKAGFRYDDFNYYARAAKNNQRKNCKVKDDEQETLR